jgi:hypothetical protein
MGLMSSFNEEEDEPPQKGRGFYKPKNPLDGFLRRVIEGKYKWRRYKIFYEYLEQGRGYPHKEAEAIVARYQAHGVDDVRDVMRQELNNWMRSRRQLRGKKAVATRWNKYRAQQQQKPKE